MSTPSELPLLGVKVEVWPVAADQLGIWLISPEADAWRSEHITADTEPHKVVGRLLDDHDEFNRVRLLHSTSWRTDRDAVVLTYIAVLGGHGSHEYVLDLWPEARPLSLGLTEAVGKPMPHGPIDPPTPRYIDVLLHAVRHLRFLLDTDTHAQAALDDLWQTHLYKLQPALAGMYQW
ncbi:hypothetical protein ACQP10_38500 (plasmid) [Streptosporangium sandarakinum]|uniref:hypothetical protein n=1 Tax=Streptosporangium TaxID=2000 RepID=UPI0031FA0017